MSAPVVVRPLVEADWPQVHDLVVEVARAGETYALDVPSGIRETRDFWVGEHLVVAVDAERPDRVLGAAKAGPNRPAQGSHVGTASFMVSGSARGRGVGRLLGEEVVGWHREAGFGAIQFNAVVATNTAAVALWQSLGFAVVGRVPAAFRRPSGAYADLLVMHLDLTPSPVPPVGAERGSDPADEPGPERDRVLDAAGRLFPAQGYAGTTLGQVAAESGVSASRIHRLVGSKGEVFSAMVWRHIIGAHPDLQSVFDELRLEEEPDVDVRLDRVAATVLEAASGMAHLVPVIAEAISRDPVVRGIVQGAELQRVGTSRMLVRVLTRGTAPRPDAVPEVQMLCSGEAYRSMAAFGWSRERHAAWLRQAFDHAVNGPGATPGPGPATARLPG
ncbi:GNAT family N-acetyltransferase [Nocardioides aurantiacus]|uniref:GNAT family N-acetyltransferase n=1 Tax=Nocardioides aurantiacus TaxID=86796 RepID=UPI00403F5867